MRPNEYDDLLKKIRCSDDFRSRMQEKLSAEPSGEPEYEEIISDRVEVITPKRRWSRIAAAAAAFVIIGGAAGGTAYHFSKVNSESKIVTTDDGSIYSALRSEKDDHYMMIGGAPLALTYKAINTMDSMVGYKNERYMNFGRGPAHLDDLAGLIPSRLAALMWIAAAGMMERSAGSAWRIWRRDNRNHPSPNSAQTESAVAGALHIRLAGDAWYFGVLHHKPTQGDADRPVEPEDIRRTEHLMEVAAGLVFAAGELILMAISLALM